MHLLASPVFRSVNVEIEILGKNVEYHYISQHDSSEKVCASPSLAES